MQDNYIVFNGKRVDLTQEQIEKLGLVETKDNSFKRKNNKFYYFIRSDGEVNYELDIGGDFDSNRYDIANYCTDKSLMEQRALHETLSRLLWRFSMEHDGDKIDWNNHDSSKYCVSYDHIDNEFTFTANAYTQRLFTPHFYSREIAQRAIDEIVKPFMKQHPEFVW